MKCPVEPRTESLQIRSLEFLGEQKGLPETLLKDRLVHCLRNCRGVARAYLAQVQAEGQFGVALCVRNASGADADLVRDIGEIFAGIFGAQEHLDIFFLEDAQEAALSRVCPPFFYSSRD